MILITGGMGFIGLHTARRFLDVGEDVVMTYYKQWREPSFIKDEIGGRATVEQLDITDGAALLDVVKKHKVDGIVHLAVPGLFALPPADDYRVNTEGLINILEAAREGGVRRITLGSSVVVYFGLEHGPWSEATSLPARSVTPTETWKKAWEIMGMHYADRTGLDVVFARIGGFWGPLYHSLSSVNSQLVHAAVKGETPGYAINKGGGGFSSGAVPFEEDTNVSDLCYVKDGARGLQMLQMAEKLEHRIYNVGGGQSVPNGDVASAIRKVIPDFVDGLQKGRNPNWKPDSYMDITRISSELGFKPEYDVNRGVADYVEWLQAGNEL